MKSITLAIVVSAALCGRAMYLSENDIVAAADAFLTRDAIGSSVLFGRAVKTIEPRGNLWIAHLAPSGYIVLAGSDEAEPIPFFSPNDFSEPDPRSPFAVALAGADEACERLEGTKIVKSSLMLMTANAAMASLPIVTAAEDRASVRKARWAKLLGEQMNAKLMTAPLLGAGQSATTVVEPFLTTHWNQNQPYNDYAPVCDVTGVARSGYESYRGRVPCGCVATAAAQNLYYWKWPVRVDDIRTVNHQFAPEGNEYEDFPMRFDGRVPLDWSNLQDEYRYYWFPDGRNYSYDMRNGGLAESSRQPLARLVFLCGSLANMKYAEKGSSANFNMFCGACPWYQGGEMLTLQYEGVLYQVDRDEKIERIRGNLLQGIPVQVVIPGHEIVGHGWKEDSSAKYLYVNYGWGGSHDGYYNIDDADSSSGIEDVYVDFVPRRMVQLDPIPKVSGTAVVLHWHLPRCYEGSVTGFTVLAKKRSVEPSNFSDDFSISRGVATTGRITVKEDVSISTTPFLSIESVAAGDYLFGESFQLTSRSVLTYDFCRSFALGMKVEMQVSLDDGDWKTVSAPTGNETLSSKTWMRNRVYLGGYGGHMVKFRVHVTHSGSGFYSTGFTLLDNFNVSDVMQDVLVSSSTVAATERSCTLSGLTSATRYAFSVVPNFDDGIGEALDVLTTETAGSIRQLLPGEELFTVADLKYAERALTASWNVVNDNSSSIGNSSFWIGPFSGSVSVVVDGKLTQTSNLSFEWKTYGYYGNATDTLTAFFVDMEGNQFELWNETVLKDMPLSSKKIELGRYAGKSGRVIVNFRHPGTQYSGKDCGVLFESMALDEVLMPSLPNLVWSEPMTKTALGMPEIKSVSSDTPAFAEGFYRENAMDHNVFYVECSESVTALTASPSHVAILPDDKVTVHSLGKGKFAVEIDASQIPMRYGRTRMILTLAASDENGTTVCKDLSMRFSTETEAQKYVGPMAPLAVEISEDGFEVSVPASWFEEMGLISSGATPEQLLAAAQADTDGDGFANWKEYVCGTNPKLATDKLTCLIAMENGVPRLDYSPKNLIAGVRPVFKGRSVLGAGGWSTANTATHKFFKVVIEQVK